ncbi:MAG: glycosyltransferase family 4 protein [Lachnospiraceae bacterium]|nr:glycosyltransferase family 4 protein [Lachnospiraceae bacterium]
MKISFFIGSTSGGGAERVVCNLANRLVLDEYEVQILTVNNSDSYGLDSRIECISLEERCKQKNRYLKKIEKLYSLKLFLKRNRTDLYIVFLPVEVCMFMHYRKCTDTPIILSERNDPSSYSKLMQLLLRYYASKARGMIFQTEEARQWYKLEDRVHTEVIPNPIAIEFIADQGTYTRNHNGNIIGVGRLSPQKNWSMLLNAYAKLPDEFRSHKLVIYGQGNEEKKLKQLSERLKIEKDVCFPGFCRSIKDALKEAELFVLSSNYEGMPNVLMEAMAMGLPCIATNCPIGGTSFLIRHDENGMLVEVGNTRELTAAIMTLLSDKDKADRMGIEAKKIGEKLHPEKVYSMWKNFIQEQSI